MIRSLAIFLISATIAPQSAWPTIITGPTFSVSGSIAPIVAVVGEPIVGRSSISGMRLHVGAVPAWYAPPIIQIPGDFDGDGDVDLVDFGIFQICFTGPGGSKPFSECSVFDCEGDQDVDLVDFACFQKGFTGPLP
jgi:hypothetical protein